MLEEAQLVRRDYQATIPPQVTYSLAPRGAELTPMLDMVRDIAMRWQSEDAQPVRQAARRPSANASRLASTATPLSSIACSTACLLRGMAPRCQAKPSIIMFAIMAERQSQRL